jgi:hypothetical protein
MYSKYAVIICASDRGYWMGANATLNAIDYYGMKDIDVHFGYNVSLDTWIANIKKSLPYNIYTYLVPEICGRNVPDRHPYARDDHDFLWARWGIADRIKNDYEAVMFIDGRCMLMNNVSPQLERVANSGLILCPDSPFTHKTLSKYRSDGIADLDDLCRALPARPNILFMDLKNHHDVIERMWAAKDNYLDDKHLWEKPCPVDCYLEAYFVKNLFVLDKVHLLEYLPWKVWLHEHEIHIERLIEHTEYPQGASLPSGERINNVRGTYWGKDWTDRWLNSFNPESSAYKCIRQNINVLTNVSKFLNYHWKSRLDAPEISNLERYNSLEREYYATDNRTI